MSTIKPIGERVAIVSLKESYEGKIILPESKRVEYLHGRCIAVGDGVDCNGTVKPIYAKVDEVYIYQLDQAQKVNATFSIDGQDILMLHQADMICRLNEKIVTMASVDMMGHWILVEPYVESTGSIIVVPETVKEHQHELHHYKVLKQGQEVTLGCSVGDEIYPARGRLTPFSIEGKIYAFIQDSFIYGFSPAVEISPILN